MIAAGRVALISYAPTVNEVTGVLASSFGGMTATIVGTRTVNGALVSSFGGMTATMAGTVTRTGVLVSAFGGMTATAIGTIPGLGTVAAKLNPVSTLKPATVVRTFNA